MTEQVDRKDLKIKALQQRLTQMFSQYEDQISNLRVDYTILEQQKEKEIQDLSAQLSQALDKVAELSNMLENSEELDLSTVMGEVVDDVSEEHVANTH